MLYVNGVQLPSVALNIDQSSPFWATMAEEKLFSSSGINRDGPAHMITMEVFTKCFYILGFDLPPDRGRRIAYEPST